MIISALEKKGLTSQEAESLLSQYGKNILPEKPPPTDLTIFISQLKNPLVYILLIAGIITFLLHEYTDTSIILIAVFVNTILGFIQERKANRSLEALKKMIHPMAKVIRDGKTIDIGTELVVPGDLVVLHQGDRVCADGQVIEANRFFVNEAMLTGESMPVQKNSNEKGFMGTVVVGGNALLMVEKTGSHTEIGGIALSVLDYSEETPLRRELARFSKLLSVIVLVLVVIVFFIGVVRGKDLFEIFTTSVALAVSAIPEGLLVGLTVVLAVGMQRILAKKGLVRSLVSAETLGGVTTICMDKTGTLTYGAMSVTEVIGNKDEIALQAILANDLDDPLVIAAFEWANSAVNKEFQLKKADNSFDETYAQLDSLPFSSKSMFFASLNKLDDHKCTLFINGAPEVILEKCKVSEERKHEILSDIDKQSNRGNRLLGFIRKDYPLGKTTIEDEDLESGFEWVGIIGFSDPVRPDVLDSLRKTRRAGIKLIIITGDYAKTSLSVLKQLDIHVSDDNIFLGDDVEKLTTDELEKKLSHGSDVKLFARTKPDQKLKIVESLKNIGEVVAMTGDGVNDAPALAKADIGIVVGDATEVAKETSDLILLDSSFSTIVSAIEEGRGIFDNIRKIILYLVSDGYEEILLVIGTLILHIPLPISAAQILYINLVSDGFPHLALSVDPRAKDIMHRPPRPSNEPLIAKWMLVLVGIISLTGGLFAIALYIFVLNTTSDVALARSVTFAAVGINSLFYVFSIKNLRESFWEENMFANKWLVLAVCAGIVLQILPFVWAPLGALLRLQPLGIFWVPVIISSLIMFVVIEVCKEVFDRFDGVHGRHKK